MGLILYECPPDFPRKIPGFLEVDGLTVSADGKRLAKIKHAKKEFAYRIRDGVSELNLAGGEDEDGFVGFFIVSPWSWSARLVHKQKALYDRVGKILLQAGARIWNEKK
jgi:hypothetical protein